MAVPKRNPARRNVSATKATLSREHDVTAPALPERLETPWHQLTTEWWADIWASPMAPEYDSSDVHGLYVLADLIDSYWYADTPRARGALAAEIRLQRQCFGLTPIDRRRLQWEIERTSEAQDKGARRRAAQKPASVKPGDALGALRAV